VSEYSTSCIDIRADELPISADPCVAARHVTGRLLDLSHVSWRTCVADLLADHMHLAAQVAGWMWPARMAHR